MLCKFTYPIGTVGIFLVRKMKLTWEIVDEGHLFRAGLLLREGAALGMGALEKMESSSRPRPGRVRMRRAFIQPPGLTLLPDPRGPVCRLALFFLCRLPTLQPFFGEAQRDIHYLLSLFLTQEYSNVDLYTYRCVSHV